MEVLHHKSRCSRSYSLQRLARVSAAPGSVCEDGSGPGGRMGEVAERDALVPFAIGFEVLVSACWQNAPYPIHMHGSRGLLRKLGSNCFETDSERGNVGSISLSTGTAFAGQLKYQWLAVSGKHPHRGQACLTLYLSPTVQPPALQASRAERRSEAVGSATASLFSVACFWVRAILLSLRLTVFAASKLGMPCSSPSPPK